MNNLFLIDLDHTLFDTEKYKVFVSQKLIDILGTSDLVEEFWIQEKELRNQPDHFTTVVDKWSGRFPNPEEVRRSLKILFYESDFSAFIFPDVLDSLTNLKEFGTCWLFSTGDVKLQLAKIAHSELRSKFDEIKIFDNKLEFLPQVYNEYAETHRVWFIDNHLSYLKLAHDADQKLKTVHIRRYDFETTEEFKPTLEIETLTEFCEYIKTT